MAQKSPRTKIILILLVCSLVLFSIGIYIVRSNKPSINSFEDCVAAGNPVMLSYPAQCSADGKTYADPNAAVEEQPRVPSGY